MVDLKNKSIADTFNAKLDTPWVWLVIVLTIGLTILFYFSQKPQIAVYSQYIKALSEYQLLESNLMRSMEHVRTGFGADSVLVQSQTMMLREMTVSFSRELDEQNSFGIKVPPSVLTSRFEKEVLGKVSGMRRYTAARMAWMESWNKVVEETAKLTPELQRPLSVLLDSARAGFSVSLDGSMILPDTLAPKVLALLSENSDLFLAWSKFDNDVTMLYSMDLMQFFQMKTMDEVSLKSKIPMVFYFLSLVLLLSTFFFLFRSRN